jgi:Pilus biogenesis CpaD protein (pilus_cpaD)
MNTKKMNFTHATASLALVLAATLLSGCVWDDVLADDSVHAAPHSSEAYPLEAMRGRGDLCGQWPDDLTESSNNSRYANHGCAVQANIAAMVADPRTLKQPRRVEPKPGEAAAAAVRTVTKGGSTSGGGGGLFGSLFGP